MLETERKEALRALAQNAAMICKATVAIFDADRNIIVASSNAAFCSAIRRCPEIDKLCETCDLMGFSKCAATKKPYLYSCHMGLLEISAPIIYGETLLGYIIIGQFTNSTDKKKIRSAVTEACRKYRFSPTLPLQEMESIVYLSEEYTEALTQLIELCANYIWLNQIIDLSGSNLAVEIRLYIADHLTDDLSVDALCGKFSLSPTALYQLFKKAFGCGLAQVVRDERIKKAKQLLGQQKISVGDVASQVGIEDANYFSRLFKNDTGMTPLAFRRQAIDRQSHHPTSQ